MQIEVTPNLLISPFQPGDAAALVELLSDREIYRHDAADSASVYAGRRRKMADGGRPANGSQTQTSCAIRQASGDPHWRHRTAPRRAVGNRTVPRSAIGWAGPIGGRGS